MNFIKHNIRLIVIILLNLIVFCFYVYLLNSIHDTELQTATYKGQAALARKNETEIFSLQKSLKEKQDSQGVLQSYFVDSGHIAPLLETFENLGKIANVDASISGVDITRNKPIVLRVSIKTIGTFQNVYYFLNLLENAPYELTVTQTNLNQTFQPVNNSSKGSSSWEGDFIVEIASFTN